MFDVPMIPFAALDSNSLMSQLGAPRIIGSYDSNNIMNMPSAYSRPMMGSMGNMGGMNMNSAMGLVGAAVEQGKEQARAADEHTGRIHDYFELAGKGHNDPPLQA